MNVEQRDAIRRGINASGELRPTDQGGVPRGAAEGPSMTYQILEGHVIDRLREMPAESVQTSITSPPYFSLRAYGTEPQVWGGQPDHAHEWAEVFAGNQNSGGGVTRKQSTNRGSYSADGYCRLERPELTGGGCTSWKREYGGPLPRKVEGPRGRLSSFCSCSAWKGELGSEPTLDLFIEHLVEVFSGVRRVLRPDGTLWVNMGDSYNGSGGAGGDYNAGGLKEGQARYRGSRVAGLKPKDLCMTPFRFALAMQADGWWLRSVMPWLKLSSMPESAQDRPVAATEYFFQFTRSPQYFYDPDAVRRPAVGDPGRSRSYRNTDPWFDSLDALIEAQEAYCRYLRRVRHQGPLTDETGQILALNINPEPSPYAHTATFGPRLITPLLLASTSEAGCCSECGKPWKRETEKERRPNRNNCNSKSEHYRGVSGGVGPERRHRYCKGFSPDCSCGAPARPSLVLDPFSGTGTTGVVALSHGRDYVGIELQPQYAEQSRERLSKVTVQTRLFTGPAAPPAPQPRLFENESAA